MRYCHCGNETSFGRDGARSEQASTIENLAGALRLLKNALNLDPLEAAARLTRDAIVEAGFVGDPRESVRKLMRQPVDTAAPDLKTLAKSRVENISDHDMNQGYLKLLGTRLKVERSLGMHPKQREAFRGHDRSRIARCFSRSHAPTLISKSGCI